MKLLYVALALYTLPVTGPAQVVQGNEAVRFVDGVRKVSTPPLPKRSPPLCRADARCHAGAWRMVEGADGLRECTEPWARPGTCRASTYGTERLRRVWVAQHQGRWLQCQFPVLGSRCVDMAARPPANLPTDAVQ